MIRAVVRAISGTNLCVIVFRPKKTHIAIYTRTQTGERGDIYIILISVCKQHPIFRAHDRRSSTMSRTGTDSGRRRHWRRVCRVCRSRCRPTDWRTPSIWDSRRSNTHSAVSEMMSSFNGLRSKVHMDARTTVRTAANSRVGRITFVARFRAWTRPEAMCL